MIIDGSKMTILLSVEIEQCKSTMNRMQGDLTAVKSERDSLREQLKQKDRELALYTRKVSQPLSILI